MNTNETFGERWGRLGNQLFQLAVLFAIRQHRGHEFYLPRTGQSLWDCFDLDVPADGPPCGASFVEVNGSCNFDRRVFEQPCGTGYHGYFQSYRYLEDCRLALLRFLQFKLQPRALSEVNLFRLQRYYQRPLVSLHVRRGDYLNPDAEDSWGNLAKDGYYRRAVEAIGDDATYVVFSDDLEWCRQSLGLDRVVFADLDAATSLCLMSRCDVNVVANSSFSWWAAYLNPDAEVYAPSRWWRAMSAPNDRQEDIVPPYWRTIPTFANATEPAQQGGTV